MDWGPWFELSDKTTWPTGCGIYRVRFTDDSGAPLPIERIGGTDAEAIVYIGRSGVSTARSDRGLATRLSEFYNRGSHSGGWTYRQAVSVLEELGRFTGHHLQASVVELADDAIERAEKQALRDYFNVFGELPPFNSSFLGKWETHCTP